MYYVVRHSFVHAVEWSYRAACVRERHGILVLWMEEALRDPNVLEIDPDPSSRSRRSTRTIGYSVIDGFLVTVITLREESTVHGVNGWRSDPPEQCRYRREIER